MIIEKIIHFVRTYDADPRLVYASRFNNTAIPGREHGQPSAFNRCVNVPIPAL